MPILSKKPAKRILLIDRDDTRRKTRIKMLEQAGYQVTLRVNHVDAETLDHEGHFDLVILSLHRKKLEEAAAYGDRLRNSRPDLPILLLTDAGVFVPHGALNTGLETGFPFELMQQIAHMLAGSTHIREIEPKAS